MTPQYLACFFFFFRDAISLSIPVLARYRNESRRKIAPQQLGEFECLGCEKDIFNRHVHFVDFLSHGPIHFQVGWDLQRSKLNAHIQRISDASNSSLSQFLSKNDNGEACTEGRDTIFFLQHKPVYTLGTASDENFITTRSRDVPVVRMDRGGEVTYHGPGQLTVYPILDLRGYKQDIHWYIRALEEAVIVALSNYGLQAERKDGITGVWIEDTKVAAVGVKCRKWVTMHGLAVNVEHKSLENFEGIVPCGLEGRQVACLNQYLEKDTTVEEFATELKTAIEQVFRIQLQSS